MLEMKDSPITARKDGASDIMGLLKVCGKQKDLDKGSKLHRYICEHKLLENNPYVASILVNMYARCGALAKAQEVFSKLPVRDTVMWNALIAGYTKQGHYEEALKCFDNMQREGYPPDVVTFTCALRACGRLRAAVKGEEIHENIVRLGILEKDMVLGSTLVGLYVRCGALAKAAEVLNKLSVRDVVTWTTLIAGYAQQGQGEEALKCFDNMQHDGHSPNSVTFTCALKACGSIGAPTKGEKIHERILGLGLLEKDVVLGSALVDMYIRCGVLAKAKQVFHELPIRNVVTWNVLIAGYVQQEQGEEAVDCFDSMQCKDYCPDEVTFACALKACGSIGAVAKVEKIHEKVLSLGMLEKDIVLGSMLVDVYAKCGALCKAQQVFHELPVRNVVTWTSLIAGYVQQGDPVTALKYFNNMQSEGHSPDVLTFASALKACGSIGATREGEQIHDKIGSMGILEKNSVLANTLIDMYAKCGAFANAQQLFHKLFVRDVVTWNALISGYLQLGQGEEALKCFDTMQCEGQSPDMVTFTCALKACGSIGAVAKGESIHRKIASLDMLGQKVIFKNIILGNTLVDMYARCNALTKARQAFQELPIRDKVTWNTLIAAYAQQGEGEEALKCFDSMLQEGHVPDVVTFTSALKACGTIGAITKGEQIHDEVVNLGILDKNIMLGNTLVDMYARCGALAKAQQVFYEMPIQDMVTWTALIAGYALEGQTVEALKCFERMKCYGVNPDSTTFVCVLTICRHSGLLEQAEILISKMNAIYGIEPNVEHYCCMVDLFSRAGKFFKALRLIERMPSAEYLPVWHALLGSCRKWVDVKIGRFAFENALCLDKDDAASYICMANIYTTAGMQEDAAKIEEMRAINKACSLPGCCWWTDATGKVHPFLIGYEKHTQSELISIKLKDISGQMLQEGHFATITKKDVLCAHSEKLAVACALVNTSPGTGILVVKNTQVCVSCHRAIAAISKIEGREIKLRDTNQLHIFRYGMCSCGDC